MKTPIHFLGRLVGGLLLLLSVGSFAAAPNIILVMPDDIGYGDYSCLGNPVMKTPAVDTFYRQSVRLTDFHVSPTCSPTRAALMSGAHEFRSGVTHTFMERERMALSVTTIAQVLKSAGYTTGIFGKWHLGDEAAYQPDQRGFDEVFIHGGGGIGQTYPGSCGDAPDNLYTNPAILHNRRFVKTTGYCTNVFFNRASQWIDRQRQSGTPFFAYISPNVAHTPLQCPEVNFAHYITKLPNNPEIARFFGMLENLDTNFGHLMRKLDEWGLTQNTLVIYIGGDNGGTRGVSIFNAGLHGGKGTPYQGALRVPAFFRWPAKFSGGRDIPVLTAHIDIFPTLAEAAGVPLSAKVRAQVEGRSLLPLLTGSSSLWPNRALVTHVGRWPQGHAADPAYANWSVRSSRFTLVNGVELYDLKNDPGELRNVLQQYPEVVRNLRSFYQQWWTGVQPFLVNEDAVGPLYNPYKVLYWEQFGGGPN